MRPTANQAFVLAVALLAGASLFFTVQDIRFKRGLRGSSRERLVQSGARVPVLQVVDGDELSVSLGGEPVTVRILGLSAFDPSLQDPVAQPFGRAAVQFLERNCQGREVTLVFDELKYDAKRRLLSYVQDGNGDVGERMVAQGLALTYTRYPFSRLDAYLLVEDQARREGQGLWGDKALGARAVQLHDVWRQERLRGD